MVVGGKVVVVVVGGAVVDVVVGNDVVVDDIEVENVVELLADGELNSFSLESSNSSPSKSTERTSISESRSFMSFISPSSKFIWYVTLTGCVYTSDSTCAGAA